MPDPRLLLSGLVFCGSQPVHVEEAKEEPAGGDMGGDDVDESDVVVVSPGGENRGAAWINCEIAPAFWCFRLPGSVKLKEKSHDLASTVLGTAGRRTRRAGIIIDHVSCIYACSLENERAWTMPPKILSAPGKPRVSPGYSQTVFLCSLCR